MLLISCNSCTSCYVSLYARYALVRPFIGPSGVKGFMWPTFINWYLGLLELS